MSLFDINKYQFTSWETRNNVIERKLEDQKPRGSVALLRARRSPTPDAHRSGSVRRAALWSSTGEGLGWAAEESVSIITCGRPRLGWSLSSPCAAWQCAAAAAVLARRPRSSPSRWAAGRRPRPRPRPAPWVPHGAPRRRAAPRLKGNDDLRLE